MRCYCAGARQVARRLTRFYEAELREAGMNPAQFELLATVRARPQSSQTELAAVMDLDQTTLSRNLKPLMVMGWVAKTAGAKDGRRAEYAVTDKGLRALETAIPCWERATRRMEEGLGGGMEVWPVLERLGAAAKAGAF